MEVCSIWSGYSPYLSLTERGSIHRVYCETCKADSQHEVPGATERFHAFFEKYAPGESLRERRSKALRVTEPRLRVGPRVDRDEEMIFLPPAGPIWHRACSPQRPRTASYAYRRRRRRSATAVPEALTERESRRALPSALAHVLGKHTIARSWRHVSAEDRPPAWWRAVWRGKHCGALPSWGDLYYRWSKGFLEAGKKRLAGETARGRDLGCEASALKEVVAELT